MPDLYVSNGSLLCLTHARRRAGRRFAGLRRGPINELLGSTCSDCQQHGAPFVARIQIGGESRCIQDSDGALREHLVDASCDSCGSVRTDGSRAPLVLGESRGAACYVCERCGDEYPIARSLDTEAVF
ncbi:MAG: hypothetical protein M1522_06850 [Actinobacteria bacterium]|nr:hypothetical protein [Actinomycetota bacterium]